MSIMQKVKNSRPTILDRDTDNHAPRELVLNPMEAERKQLALIDDLGKDAEVSFLHSLENTREEKGGYNLNEYTTRLRIEQMQGAINTLTDQLGGNTSPQMSKRINQRIETLREMCLIGEQALLSTVMDSTTLPVVENSDQKWTVEVENYDKLTLTLREREGDTLRRRAIFCSIAILSFSCIIAFTTVFFHVNIFAMIALAAIVLFGFLIETPYEINGKHSRTVKEVTLDIDTITLLRVFTTTNYSMLVDSPTLSAKRIAKRRKKLELWEPLLWIRSDQDVFNWIQERLTNKSYPESYRNALATHIEKINILLEPYEDGGVLLLSDDELRAIHNSAMDLQKLIYMTSNPETLVEEAEKIHARGVKREARDTLVQRLKD